MNTIIHIPNYNGKQQQQNSFLEFDLNLLHWQQSQHTQHQQSFSTYY
jgi:hypothetical protein